MTKKMAAMFADGTVALAKGSLNKNIKRNVSNKRFEFYNLELSSHNYHESHSKNIPGPIVMQNHANVYLTSTFRKDN